MNLSTVDQAILAHLKGQKEGITLQDLIDATGLGILPIYRSVVALEHARLISSGADEFPLYQLAQPKPVVPQEYAPPCTSCVRCGECHDPEPEEASIYYLRP